MVPGRPVRGAAVPRWSPASKAGSSSGWSGPDGACTSPGAQAGEPPAPASAMVAGAGRMGAARVSPTEMMLSLPRLSVPGTSCCSGFGSRRWSEPRAPAQPAVSSAPELAAGTHPFVTAEGAVEGAACSVDRVPRRARAPGPASAAALPASWAARLPPAELPATREGSSSGASRVMACVSTSRCPCMCARLRMRSGCARNWAVSMGAR